VTTNFCLAAFKLANPIQKMEHQFFRPLETKEMFQRLPSTKPKSSGGLTMEKITDPETDNPKTATAWTTITDLLIVEQKILVQNQHHFGQAAPTYLATVKLQQLLSFGGTSFISDQLLYNKLDPAQLTSHYFRQQLRGPMIATTLKNLNMVPLTSVICSLNKELNPSVYLCATADSQASPNKWPSSLLIIYSTTWGLEPTSWNLPTYTPHIWKVCGSHRSTAFFRALKVPSK
jgi:hypothetical protein